MPSHVDDGATLTPAVSVLHVMPAMTWRCRMAFACASTSTSRTRLPASAGRAATLTLVVVFPAAALLHSHERRFFCCLAIIERIAQLWS